jgi:hypothetical protein
MIPKIPDILQVPSIFGGVKVAAILVSEVLMPADKTKPVVNLRLDADLLEQIDEYRFEQRFRSRMAALEFLLRYAVKRKPVPSPEERG